MTVLRKSIMIFGAGLNQLELIRESGKLGFVTVVVDPHSDPPGRKEADFFYRIDGNDYETTRATALKHHVSGIVTGQMEKPLRVMARLAKELGFICNSPEVTERCLDKWLMKKALMASEVPCAKGILEKSGSVSSISLPDEIIFPVIIKPRDAYSSRGVYRCDNRDDLFSHIDEVRSFSSAGDIIIEEFLKGKEYSVEAITYNGETTIIQVTEKFITPYPTTVELGHLQPADLSDMKREDIHAVVKKALKALGIENSASHTEVMITADGPMIIEVGARLGGDFIASYLTRASTGISMDRAAIEVAMGVRPSLAPSPKAYSMISYIRLPEGRTVRKVLSIDDILNMPGVVFAALFVVPGETIRPITHSALRPGCIIVEAQTKKDLMEKISEYTGLLTKKVVLN